MNVKKDAHSKTKAIAVTILIFVILVPVGYSLVTYVFARSSPKGVPFIEMPASQYEKCVRETEYMRYHHWELLQQIRDEVVRDGIRGDIKLSSCRECHPNREQFCNQCHNAVNLQPDCFGCHYYPASTQATSGEMHGNEAGLHPKNIITEPGRAMGGEQDDG